MDRVNISRLSPVTQSLAELRPRSAHERENTQEKEEGGHGTARGWSQKDRVNARRHQLLLRQNSRQQKAKDGFVAVHNLRGYLVHPVPRLVDSAVKNLYVA